jgi:hypothetical protein
MDTAASSHHSQRGFWALVDLPALWRPRANQFAKIEAIPYLGTGKLDLRKIKELAAQAARAEEARA